jgi:hypothetical protein
MTTTQKTLPDKITLKLRAIDFKGATYVIPNRCAVSKAAMRIWANEGVSHIDLYLNEEPLDFRHSYYSPFKFDRDMKKAQKANFDDTVIRTMTLTKWN